DVKPGAVDRFESDRAWANLNIGGPILRDHLFFYSSYYRPTETQDNQSNVYGPLPKFTSTRDEYFVKLTATPMQSLLLDGSYRHSHRLDKSASIGSFEAPTAGTGEEATFRVGILEGSWIINPKSYATAKFNDYGNPGATRPDNLLDFELSTAPG